MEVKEAGKDEGNHGRDITGGLLIARDAGEGPLPPKERQDLERCKVKNRTN